jgi:imidazolonepropionase-like amidohydrolase
MGKPQVDELPSYDHVVRNWSNRRRSRQLIRATLTAGLLFFGYYVYQIASNTASTPTDTKLSISKLQSQYASCASLRSVPNDPSGPREFSKRWTEGVKPVLIRNATVWTGEPAPGTSKQDAKAGKGYSWIKADVLLHKGLIIKVSTDGIEDADLPDGYTTFDAKGRQLTAGIVDMHSHAGMGEFAGLGDDTNELSDNITPYIRSLDAFNPLAPEIQWIKSGGVTTSLILPGSGNNMGGEAYVLKLAAGNSSGRPEVSQEDMLADPDKNWRYMKMACGENAKSVYGKIGRGPFSRLGEAWQFRHALETAQKHVEAQDDWCSLAERIGPQNMDAYLPSDIEWESLSAVLRGQVRVNTHCYTVADLDSYVRHTNEFKFRVYAFHHAHQTYLVPELLKRAYGGTPAAALFADNMYYKVEAYTATEKAGNILWDNDIVPVYVSDNPVLNSQHVLFEAAKAYGFGLPYHVALAGVTSAPAALLGLGERVGKVVEGFDADIVVWDSDPLSVAAAPVQVWIDGAPQFSKPVELKKPATSPIKPDLKLSKELKRESMQNVVFAGISKVFTSDDTNQVDTQLSNKVVVSDGIISCIGACEEEVNIAVAKSAIIIELKNGYLTPAFTAFGSSLGLLEIDAAKDTQDGGYNSDSFARAVDGLALDGKQLEAALEHGVTRAISAPSRGSIDAKGISVGFNIGALGTLEKGAVWQEDVAVHYPLTSNAKSPSISAAIGNLREKLLKAAKLKSKSDKKEEEPTGEDYYFQQVITGKLPLVLSVHKADTIAAIIRLKTEVEKVITKSSKSHTLSLVIIGAAESYLVAKELASANISVVLAPLLPYSQSWDERRSLTGAPLTNGTAIDFLLDAGVLVAISGTEIWETRNLGLMAAWAFKNGEGRLNETTALDLVGANIYKMLGIKVPKHTEDWLVWEGSPLEIGAKLKGLAWGGKSTVWI